MTSAHDRIDAPSLWGHIVTRAAATPAATLAVDETGRSITFGDYLAACEKAAAGLAELGVGEGTAVSWQLPTWIESLVLVGALCRLGAQQNPLLHIYRDREVGFALQQTQAKLMVVPSTWRNFDFADMARRLAPAGCSVLVVDRQLPQGAPSSLPDVPVSDGNQMRWVFYTSGTTADPKGAKHTDRTIRAAAMGMVDPLDVTSSDRSALVFPFTHIGGICWLYAALITGCELVIDEGFGPATVEYLRREDITLAGSGTAFHQLYLAEQRKLAAGERLFPSVRAYPGGAAPKPPQLHFDLKAEIGGVGIVSGYGLTECPILSMASVHDSDDELAHTEGKPTAGVDLHVVTADGSLAEPGDGRDGEIRVKAPQLFLGYLDSSLDAAAFDADGYFRTGDLGRQDALGNVIITGRLKDVIIRKGENISAKEVEDVLYGHPKIADVAVIGLPDPASGERACAVVSCKDGVDPLTFDEMVSFCKGAGLMVQKIPEQLELVDIVPRNPAGKVLKNDLRQRYGG